MKNDQKLSQLTTGDEASATHSSSARQPAETVHTAKSDGTTLTRLTYTYDKVNNKQTQVDRDGVTTTWTYDKAYQLEEEESGTKRS